MFMMRPKNRGKKSFALSIGENARSRASEFLLKFQTSRNFPRLYTSWDLEGALNGLITVCLTLAQSRHDEYLLTE